MSVQYLKDAIAAGELKLLIDVPPTDRDFILQTIDTQSAATLAHLFFHLHFFFVRRSGEWIHDGLDRYDISPSRWSSAPSSAGYSDSVNHRGA